MSEANMTEKEKQVEIAKRLLGEHGFKLSVGSCGCCKSPWVRLTYDGTEIVFDVDKDGNIDTRDNVRINMHDKPLKDEKRYGR